jgi:hypothetical protein
MERNGTTLLLVLDRCALLSTLKFQRRSRYIAGGDVSTATNVKQMQTLIPRAVVVSEVIIAIMRSSDLDSLGCNNMFSTLMDAQVCPVKLGKAQERREARGDKDSRVASAGCFPWCAVRGGGLTHLGRTAASWVGRSGRSNPWRWKLSSVRAPRGYSNGFWKPAGRECCVRDEAWGQSAWSNKPRGLGPRKQEC